MLGGFATFSTVFTKEAPFLGLLHLIKTKIVEDALYFVLSPFKLFAAFHSLWKRKLSVTNRPRE